MHVKKILLIAYNFPPLISPQSLRWFYLSKELCKQGYTIDVLTIRMSERFQDLLADIPEGIRIHKTFPGPFYYFTFRYSRESSNKKEYRMSANPSPFWKTLSNIHSKIYKILNSLLIPDIYAEWLPFVLKTGLKLIRKNNYDTIISSSEPRVCHLIGYFLKKKSGVPWIADYGDPWIYPIPILSESDMKKSIIKKIEMSILRRMDAITVTSEGIKKLYQEQYPFLRRESIHVVTQGFDPDVFSQIEGALTRKFRIVYCGSFYRDLRDPKAFFEAVKEIDKDIEVIIAGRINEFADVLRKENFHGRIQFRGFLSHKESLALEKGATILLHIGNISDVQVPGKIYEYIGAGKPILGIKGGDSDLSAEIIIRYNKGIVVTNNVNAIKEAILKLYELWQRDSLDKTFNLNTVEEFTWSKKAEDFSNIIERL
jgi:hypothetical protein